jgi:Helix-turn-helix domain of resolvase
MSTHGNCKYYPEVCKEVIALMMEGYSIKEVAYKLKIARSTLYLWMEEYKELSDTVKDGVDFGEGFWMCEGRENLHNKDFNSTLWYMNMKNRFGWKDKTETENNHDVKVSEVTQRIVRNAEDQYK